MVNTQIMGVLNVTPDSFYDGGRFLEEQKAVAQGIKLVEQGADILDIGGESTRPPQIYARERGPSIEISIEEECSRVLPVISEISSQSHVTISIDTRKPEVAKLALEAGASFINDVSGLKDPKMIELASDTESPVCIMHMDKTFQMMQEDPIYKPNVTSYLLDWFEKKINKLISSGIKQKNIIIDPGICFGKTLAHNLEILQNIDEFKIFNCRILIGASRKSFLKQILGKKADLLLPGTLGISTFLMNKGIDILRVHDVEEHQDIKKVLSSLNCLEYQK